jgi:hypothetical protein
VPYKELSTSSEANINLVDLRADTMNLRGRPDVILRLPYLRHPEVIQVAQPKWLVVSKKSLDVY